MPVSNIRDFILNEWIDKALSKPRETIKAVVTDRYWVDNIDFLKDYVETRNKIKLMNKKCSKEAIKTVVSFNELEDEASRQ